VKVIASAGINHWRGAYIVTLSIGVGTRGS